MPRGPSRSARRCSAPGTPHVAADKGALASILHALGRLDEAQQLLDEAVSTFTRSSVFSVRHATLNAGLGIGALLAALIVDVADPSTFTTLFLADAATYVVFIPILLTVPDQRPAHDADQPGPGGGLATILCDRVFVRVAALRTRRDSQLWPVSRLRHPS